MSDLLGRSQIYMLTDEFITFLGGLRDGGLNNFLVLSLSFNINHHKLNILLYSWEMGNLAKKA